MIPRTLLIRADANIAMGTGHVMRCLALAQAWQVGGGRTVFVMTESTPTIKARLLAEECEVLDIAAQSGMQEDVAQTIALAHEKQADWIVVDGYQFSAQYQQALKSANRRILFLDDYGHAEHYSADLVLNQNVSASVTLYKNREPYTRLLLGTRYCMLRREFNSWQGWNRHVPDVGRKLLVTIGGSDPDNVTLQIVQALERIALDLDVVVVMGGSNPHLDSMKRVVQTSRHRLRVLANVSNMPELMGWADMAVSGAGSTCWEICALGLPALLICVAQNQEVAARSLAELGAVRLLDDRSEAAIATAIDQLANRLSLREQICRTARELVDFNGASRVVAELENK